jgi:cysteine-rich repeat protein
VKTVTLLVFVAGLGLAACGSDDKAASPPVSVDVSDTAGDASSGDASSGDASSGDASSMCEGSMAECISDDGVSCETDIATDAAHCGACASACESEHGAGSCEEGVCAFECDEGYQGEDCSDMVPDCDNVFLDCGEHGSCAMVDGEPTCQCDEHFAHENDVCVAICGDGVVVGSESCDDGNTLAGDGCRTDCAGLEVCGDGLVDEALDETCDDGNLENDDGCDDRCFLEPFEGPCGDGVINIGEACDDGNDEADDGCDDCIVTLTDDWTCDPAIFNASDGCDCGCGQMDADCEDATVDSCTFCGGEGTCNPGDAVCQLIASDNNGVCQ